MEKYERGIFLPRDKCRLVVWIERELRRNDIFFFLLFLLLFTRSVDWIYWVVNLGGCARRNHLDTIY